MLSFPSIYDELNPRFWGDEAILDDFGDTTNIKEEDNTEWITVVKKPRNVNKKETLEKVVVKRPTRQKSHKFNSHQKMCKSNSIQNLRKCQSNQKLRKCQSNPNLRNSKLSHVKSIKLECIEKQITNKNMQRTKLNIGETFLSDDETNATTHENIIVFRDETIITPEETIVIKDKTIVTHDESIISTQINNTNNEKNKTNENIERVENKTKIKNIKKSTIRKIKTTTQRNCLKLKGTVQNIIPNGCGFIKSTTNSENGIFMFLETKDFKIGDNVLFKIKKNTNRMDNQHFQRAFNPKLQK